MELILPKLVLWLIALIPTDRCAKAPEMGVSISTEVAFVIKTEERKQIYGVFLSPGKPNIKWDKDSCLDLYISSTTYTLQFIGEKIKSVSFKQGVLISK